MLKKLPALALCAALLAALPAAAEEMTLDEVLAAHFETIGGEDAWRAVDSMTMNGTMAMAQMGIEAPFSVYFKRPMKTRIEFTVQGMTGIQAYDGETAWFIMPFMGKNEPEPMPAEMAEQMMEQADLNPLLDWKEKGYEVELVGKEEADGTEAYKIKLTRPSGNVRYYYLDTDYYLPFKVEGKTTIQGNETETETILGDYKEVDGLVLAHSIESRPKGADAGQVMTFESIEVGSDLGDDLFDMEAAMPEKPAEDGGEG